MLSRVFIGVLALAAVSTPAFAAGQCDSGTPAVPVIPSVAEVTSGTVAQGEAKLNATQADVKLYQSQLKDYRACLNAAMAADQVKAKDSKDTDGSKKAADEFSRYEGMFNASVDSEQAVAQQFNADAKAHCARDTSDFCKPKS